MTNGLNPCPCCGAQASVMYSRTASLGLQGWLAHCTVCTESSSFVRFDRQAAEQAWNNYASVEGSAA